MEICHIITANKMAWFMKMFSWESQDIIERNTQFQFSFNIKHYLTNVSEKHWCYIHIWLAFIKQVIVFLTLHCTSPPECMVSLRPVLIIKGVRSLYSGMQAQLSSNAQDYQCYTISLNQYLFYLLVCNMKAWEYWGCDWLEILKSHPYLI